MAAFDPAVLNQQEENSETSLIGSIGAGVATGLIKIPEGAFSLFANIYDLTNDTSTATELESWFDENIYKKLGNIEEKAESTTAGKITSSLINIGVPGGIAFRYGTKAATKAIQYAKAGKYFNLNNKKLSEAAQKALTLNGKEKTLKYIAGATAGGAAEGVFVADAENFGTIGDLLGGPTDLNDISGLEGRDAATEVLLNRLKFGTEGALLTGVIGGTGSLIKRVATRGKELKYSNSFTDRLLNNIARKFRPRGDNQESFFLTKGEQVGKRSADLNRATELSRGVDRDIDRIYPNIKSTFNKTTRDEKIKLYGDLEDVMFSGKPGIDKAGRVTMGEMDSKLVNDIGERLLKNGAKPEHITNIFKNIGLMRGKWANMATLTGSKLPLESMPQWRAMIGGQFKQWLGRTYQVFEKKSLIPFFNYKPAAQAVARVGDIFMRQNRRAIARAEARNMDLPKGQAPEIIPAPLTQENADLMVNNIVKGVKQDTDFMKLIKDTDSMRSIRTPRFNIKTDFVRESVADDVARYGIFEKKLEQAVRKGRYANIGKDGLPERTVIGQGSKAFRELFGEVKDVRQKMLHGTERLSMIARRSEFLQKLIDDSANAVVKGARGIMYNSEAAAKNAFGDAEIVKYTGSPVSGGRELPWGQTASQNPIVAAFPEGAWMERSVAEAIDGVEQRLINDKTISFVYDSLFLFPKATSQFAKTVLSPITHARNFFSAATFQTANGIWFENPKVLAAAWRDATRTVQPQLLGTNKTTYNNFYRKLLKMRVTNSNSTLGDITGVMSDINYGSRLTTDRAAKMMLQPTWAKKFTKSAQDMYVMEDDFWKISGYIMERYRYKNAYKAAIANGKYKGKMPTALELDEMSANIIRNTVPNYEYVPEFIRNLRRLPLGNFVSFPAEMLRTTTGIVQQSIKEIQDPVLRAIGMKRLAGLTATVAVVPPTIVEMFKNIYDYTDEELLAMKRFLPEWSKNSTILPMKDEEGNLKYIDFSHGFAYDTITRPVQNILNAVARGETDEKTLMSGYLEGVANATSELASPFISESIWTEAFLDVLRGQGKTKDGKTLYTDETPDGEKVTAILEHLIRSQAPFSMQQMIRLGFAVKGTPSKDVGPFKFSGETYDLTDEALGFTGYRPVPVDPARSLNFMMGDYQRSIRNSRREFNSKLLSGEPITEQDIVDRFIIANKAKWENMKEMSENLTAGTILGVGPEDLTTLLGRISKKDALSLLQGRFTPFSVSEGIQGVFQNNADKLGVENPYIQAESAIQGLTNAMDTISLSEPEFPDLTDMFNFSGPVEDTSSTPIGTPNINPQQYARPSLRLQTQGSPINNGLTRNQQALLSPSEQAIVRRTP
tara:strand:- start:193 stop:4239 length:4047 start_codon:yes stop_codon:yes gene_type:complete